MVNGYFLWTSLIGTGKSWKSWRTKQQALPVSYKLSWKYAILTKNRKRDSYLFKSEKTLLTFLEKTKVIELLDQNDYPHISVPALAALSYLRRTGFNERLFKKQEEALQKYGFIVTRSKKDKATITYQPKDSHSNYLRSKQKDQFVLGEKISCHDPKSPSVFDEAFIELEIKTEP